MRRISKTSSRSTPGLFITFEGTEGAGKSTLIRELQNQLFSLGKQVTLTREPGGTPTSEKIRELILGNSMNPWTEILLYEAARSEHLAEKIRPALQSGEIVLCDRYTDSTLAYQAHARGLPWNQVKALNRIATEGLKPHLTVFLDVDPAIGLARAQDKNRFEAEGLEFHQKVRAGFLKARAEDPKRFLTLRVKQQSPAELANHVVRVLSKKFPKIFSRVNTNRA